MEEIEVEVQKVIEFPDTRKYLLNAKLKPFISEQLEYCFRKRNSGNYLPWVESDDTGESLLLREQRRMYFRAKDSDGYDMYIQITTPGSDGTTPNYFEVVTVNNPGCARSLKLISAPQVRFFKRVLAYIAKEAPTLSRKEINTDINYDKYERYDLILPKLRVVIEAMGYRDKVKELDYCGFNDFRRFGYLRTKEQIFFYRGERLTYMKIGKGLKKLFGLMGESLDDNALKDATNRVKLSASGAQLRIVTGSDITKYYNRDNYDYDVSLGSLAESCMRHSSCSGYFKIYEDNARMLILENPINGNILGRALLWEGVYAIDEDGDRTGKQVGIMDRIYCDEKYYDKFKSWAKTNGFIHKRYQSYDNQTLWVGVDGHAYYGTYQIDLVNEIEDYDEFPYCDTFSYACNEENILSNSSHRFSYTHTLRATDGEIED